MPTSERCLIVQLADIGDLVLSSPAIWALREAKPDAHLVLLTTAHAAQIFDGMKPVDEIITFDKHLFDQPRALLKPANLRRALALARRLRRERCDTILFFHHFSTRFGMVKFAALSLFAGSHRRLGLDNGRAFFLTERLPDGGFGAQHQAQYWLDLVGLLGADTAPRPAMVGVRRHLFQRGEVAFRPANPAVPRIAIHAGSGGYSTARRWDANRFAAVADALYERFGAEIVLVGGKGDDTPAVLAAVHAPTLDLTGKTTLGELAALLQTCHLFIGADSGVMHLAAAVGTPMVALFGPSNADAWRPWMTKGEAVVLRSAPECSPCSYVGFGVGLREGCAARTCMRMVTTAQVVAAAGEMLAAAGFGDDPDQADGDTVGRGEPRPYTRLPFVGTRHASSASPAAFPNAASVPDANTSSAFPRRIRILGLPVDAITYAEWLDRIGEWVSARERARHVCTINPEFIMIAQHDVNFHNILSRADLCVPDGVGLLWAARRLGTRLPERVTGSDGVPIIAEAAAKQGWRLFLLGAAPGVAERAADVLRARFPGVQIVGTYSGSPAPAEEDALVERVNAAGGDILFVAYGAPEQDKWIARNLPRLRVAMAMGVGGAFDFIAGAVPRAPLWMQRAGLEWLFRLYLQPRRIGRMLRLPRFVLAVLLHGDR
jgi:exopolysaccharide biosynthesis WecB/TagA/CpsF family protein